MFLMCLSFCLMFLKFLMLLVIRLSVFLRSLIVPNSLYVHNWITIVAGPTDRVRRAI